jgi:3-oxoacyl-(acyl-carrier-protein) synthase
MGIISPLGIGVEDNWSAVSNGRSGIDFITRFNAESFPVQFAGEVKGFDPEQFMGHKEVKKMDRFIHFAVAASHSALKDSGYEITDESAERVGVQVGVGLGGLPAIERYHDIFKNRGVRKITPFFIPMVIANLASGQVSIHSGAKGPNTCVVTACATGTHSIGEAARLIQYGDADVMIAGGTESVITPLCSMESPNAKGSNHRLRTSCNHYISITVLYKTRRFSDRVSSRCTGGYDASIRTFCSGVNRYLARGKVGYDHRNEKRSNFANSSIFKNVMVSFNCR